MAAFTPIGIFFELFNSQWIIMDVWATNLKNPHNTHSHAGDVLH
jgi:hypothetical protein